MCKITFLLKHMRNMLVKSPEADKSKECHQHVRNVNSSHMLEEQSLNQFILRFRFSK